VEVFGINSRARKNENNLKKFSNITEENGDKAILEFHKNQDYVNLQRFLGKEIIVKDYIIFNARNRRFEKIYGVSNTNLCRAMVNEQFGETAASFIRNGFSMLRKDGNHAGQTWKVIVVTLHLNFILKDSH
jgi:hypothetical protein